MCCAIVTALLETKGVSAEFTGRALNVTIADKASKRAKQGATDPCSGIRDEDTTREVYRLVLGVCGDVTDHVNFEASGITFAPTSASESLATSIFSDCCWRRMPVSTRTILVLASSAA